MQISGFVRGASALAASVFAATAVSAQELESPQCFWANPNNPNTVNVAYPDTAARYWAARGVIPLDGEIVLRGTFPHARYMSFNVYDHNLAPVDGLADIQITPDAGAANPFVVGADRHTEATYTVRIVGRAEPGSGREPNTIYVTLADQGSPVSPWMMYRVYAPDEGRDLAGGVDLPTAELRRGDGTVVDLTATCDFASLRGGSGETSENFVSSTVNDGSLPGTPAGFPATDPFEWRKFFNLPYSQWTLHTGALDALLGTGDLFGPGQGLRSLGAPLAGLAEGGYLSNIDNAYVSGVANRDFGPVLVVRGRAPSTPKTLDGRTFMEAGDMRYWSLCSNERHSTRHIDCIYDETARLDDDGFFVAVISSPADKPAWVETCGVPWLRWGTSPETLLILRHMLPEDAYPHSIQKVPGPEEEAATLGDVLPEVTYTTAAALDGAPCPSWPQE